MTELYLMKTSEAEQIPEELCRKWFPRRFERCKKFGKRADALRGVAGGALIAGILGAKEEEISLGEWGKPHLKDGKRFFSLSHSGEYALLAVSDSDVGADIEALGVCRGAVARRVFTADELDWLEKDPDKRFFELWTAKESIIKLDGRGLSLGMESFSALGLLRCGCMPFGGRQIYGYSVFYDGYCISACSFEKLASPRLSLVTADDMIGAGSEALRL